MGEGVLCPRAASGRAVNAAFIFDDIIGRHVVYFIYAWPWELRTACPEACGVLSEIIPSSYDQ